MKYKGYTGKILKVDLTERKSETISISEKLAENYIGGVGAAAKIIAEMITPDMDPLNERNPLVFMTGPLTGTIIPWSGRHCVATISPLTGIWGEAYAGGTWGRELKKAGFDGIVITGKADQFVYLKVNNENVTIEEASTLKGKDTFETESIIRKTFNEKAKVAAIGQAGENLVKFAAVLHDGPAARTAARCGVGTVMGSKNLKAIAVAGTQDVEVAEKEKLQQSIKKVMPQLINDPEHRLKKATRIYSLFVDSGRNSVHNWRDGELKGFKESVLKETERHIKEAKPYFCAGCRTGCVESTIGTEGRLLHWEAFGPLGSQCGITNMECVQRAFDLCNRHGVDSISAGGVISFAMECFEEGLITEKDTDGIPLTFGNGHAMLTMLEKVCKREGFGSILAEGVKKAASAIGRDAERFAIEVKGLEVPAHDPRSHNFLALAYATANRGACHTDAGEPRLESEAQENPERFTFAVEGMAEKVARGQNYVGIINSLILCGFSNDGTAQYNSPMDFPGLSAKEVIEWFNLATGMERDFASLMLAGERIFNLKHLINLTRGLDPISDTLHERFITLRRQPGPLADHLPPMKEMVSEYYRIRGWEADGKIKLKKLEELGLKEC